MEFTSAELGLIRVALEAFARAEGQHAADFVLAATDSATSLARAKAYHAACKQSLANADDARALIAKLG